MVLLHEGFYGIAAWQGFLSGADRMCVILWIDWAELTSQSGLDQHPYLAFTVQNNWGWDNRVIITIL
jgi:glucan 1,3-beta-glucosidase